MALTARDLKNNDTTDAGFDLVLDPLSSPAGDVGVTKIMLGVAGTNSGLVAPTVGMPVSFNTAKDGSGTDYRPLVDADGHTQIDVVGALPAGTNAIGKLAANTGVDIGDVDVISVVPGTGATNLGKAVDSAAGATDTGLALLAVRDDALATLTPIDGDYVPIRVDANGAMWCIINGTVTVGSHAVTNAGTFAVQVDGAALTALQLLGDVVATDGSAVLTKGYQVAGTDGTNAQIVAVNTSGHVKIEDGGNSITIDGSVSQAGTWNIGTITTVVTVTTVTTVATVTNVDNVTSIDTVDTLTTLTGAAVAHDAADSGNPHKIGAKATTSLAGVTLVANADRTDLFAGVDGVQIVRTHCNLEDVVQDRATNTDGASTAFAGGLASPGAGVRLWITSIDIANSSATFVTVDIRDGAAGAVLWTLPVPATGGVVKIFNPPLRLTANTALAYDASAAVSTLTISGNGFKSKV